MQKHLHKYGFIKEQDIGRPVMLRKTTEKDEDENVVWSNVNSWKKLKNLGPFGLHDYQRVMAIFEGYNTDVDGLSEAERVILRDSGISDSKVEHLRLDVGESGES